MSPHCTRRQLLHGRQLRAHVKTVRMRLAPHALLILLCAAYIVLAGSTVRSSTVQYDEFTDLLIASSLAQHPLMGNDLDPSQARLPMYATAAASLLARPFLKNSSPIDLLYLSRWLSILMTTLAVVGTYYLGLRLFDRQVGLLAATLFAFSPYVLDFGRNALTQGDAFTAAAVVLVLSAFIAFEGGRSTASLVAFAISLSLAISTKFHLIVLIPALITYQFLAARWIPGNGTRIRRPIAHNLRRTWTLIVLAAYTGIVSLLAIVFVVSKAGQPAHVRRLLASGGLGLWTTGLLGIAACVAVAVRNHFSCRTNSDECVRWHAVPAWVAILPLALAGSLVLLPAHTLNSSIVPSLVDRFMTMDGTGRLFDQVGDAARLNIGILLLKLGLPFGLLTVAALVWAACTATRHEGKLLIVVNLTCYFLLLLALPLQQPFWLMSMYPLITLILGGFIAHLYRESRTRRRRLALQFALTGAFAWLFLSLVRLYPTFGYYGWETVGADWLGEESRGYRAPIVVTNDGSVDALEWLESNAPTGSVVLSYLNDNHLLDYIDASTDLPFDLRHVNRLPSRRASREDLLSSEYAVVRLVDDFGPATPVEDPAFLRYFGHRPVHEIFRGRGIYRMPVLRIYRRINSRH